MADSNDILSALLNREFSSDERDTVNRSFQKVNSVVQSYASLVAGDGYEFYRFPNPMEGVSRTRTPLIPMMITIVPPETLPTTFTVTRQIPSPANQEISLTGVRERFDIEIQDQGVKTVETTFISPTSPNRYQTISVPVSPDRVGELLQSSDFVTAEDETTLSPEQLAEKREAFLQKSDRSQALVEEREEQNRRGNTYLSELRDRYESFQDASTKARGRISDRNTPNTGPLRQETRDPFAANIHIKDARERQVADSLAYLRQQALRIMDLPPLFMYINPSSFSRSYEHLISDANKTRHGHMIEAWGEQQLKIAASGSVGAFYVDGKGQSSGGLAVATRKGSYAYQQFMALYQTYRSNGYIFNQDSRISLVGAVAIFYDGAIYTGSFDSFSITHSDNKPFTFDYSFNFTARFEQSLRG